MIPSATPFRILSAVLILWAAVFLQSFSTVSHKNKTKILIISSPFDHGYGTHMYEHEGMLLKKCLEQTPGVEVVLSNGWPKNTEVLQNVKSLVFYSKSAYDLMMADSVTRTQSMELLNKKVGLACIHMSTLTTNDEMIGLLGARWFFKNLPSGLNLDVHTTHIVKIDPHNPICNGWDEFNTRDEIYMSTIFNPKARPLIKVKAREGDEVVAWTFDRPNGGRSFGTTLGHFHQDFRNAAFRKLLVNAILWTAKLKIPADGANVNITDAEDILPPDPRAVNAASADPIDNSRFEKQVLVPACTDPTQIAVHHDGRVFFSEKGGNVKVYDPKTKQVAVLGTIPVYNQGEVGLMGLALDNNFDKTQALFLFFCPAEKKNTMRLSRFVIKNGILDRSSEKMLFEYYADTNNGHQGGGLYMCEEGDLLIGTGDNTNHMGELPVDQRPGHALTDAQRTSSNTASLRGKILRIHPMPDGTYTIPIDNLFLASDRTRPEIFAMGVRNGFRQSEDPVNGWIYWGDVGQNINTDLGIGPNGYDEINQARAAGNFGWPMFTGPNEAYRSWDFAAKKAGDLFDVNAPRNLSRNNTGIIDLPKPQGAFIWYPSTVSDKFPMLGSGGRSAMVGPVYHWADISFSDVRMPAAYDNSVFIFDWMRNWIKVVRIDWAGKIKDIIPFMPEVNWHKPIDIKMGPDQTLYIAEWGDTWFDNKNSQISRIIYHRGNRAPVAAISALPTAGKQPLTVKLDASASLDKDAGDELKYEWQITAPDGKIIDNIAKGTASQTSYTFTKPGTYTAQVIVYDSHGASNKASITIPIGNSMPRVKLLAPENGGFFDWQQPIAYKVSVTDAEDGSSKNGKIDPSRVSVKSLVIERWLRNANLADMEQVPQGLQLMRSTTCFSCHQINTKSIGPAYIDVAKKYKNMDVRDKLAQKIISGGSGVWSKDAAMPAHPQHTLAETRLMVNWILSLADSSQKLSLGLSGKFIAPTENIFSKYKKYGCILAINAGYNDKGAQGQPSLRGETTHILRSRLQMAVNYSRENRIGLVEIFEGAEGRCAQFKPDSYITFDDVNLKGISQIGIRAQALTKNNVVLEVHADSKDGKLICSTPVSGNEFNDILLPVKDPVGLHDLFIVVKGDDPTVLLNLKWIEFLPTEAKKSIM